MPRIKASCPVNELRWEYHVSSHQFTVAIGATADETLTTLLNTFFTEGWEVFQIDLEPGTWFAGTRQYAARIYKRRPSQEASDSVPAPSTPAVDPDEWNAVREDTDAP